MRAFLLGFGYMKIMAMAKYFAQSVAASSVMVLASCGSVATASDTGYFVESSGAEWCDMAAKAAINVVDLRNSGASKAAALSVRDGSDRGSMVYAFYTDIVNAAYSIQGRGVSKYEFAGVVSRSCLAALNVKGE